MNNRIGMMAAVVGAIAAVGGDMSCSPGFGTGGRKIEPGYGGSWPVTMPKTPPRVKKPRGQKRRHGRS